MREQDGLPLPRRISIIGENSEMIKGKAVSMTLGPPTQVSEVGPKAMLGDLEKSWTGGDMGPVLVPTCCINLAHGDFSGGPAVKTSCGCSQCRGHRVRSLVRGAHALPHVAKRKKKKNYVFLKLGKCTSPCLIHFLTPKMWVGVALDQLVSSPTYIRIVFWAGC